MFRTVPTAHMFLIRRIARHGKIMQLELSTNTYTPTAILTAVKKQQSVADWKIVDSANGKYILAFEKSSIDANNVIARFNAQVIDEQIREKLEKDFGEIRNRIVELALSPIIKA